MPHAGRLKVIKNLADKIQTRQGLPEQSRRSDFMSGAISSVTTTTVTNIPQKPQPVPPPPRDATNDQSKNNNGAGGAAVNAPGPTTNTQGQTVGTLVNATA
jgi:hypothetical protein